MGLGPRARNPPSRLINETSAEFLRKQKARAETRKAVKAAAAAVKLANITPEVKAQFNAAVDALPEDDGFDSALSALCGRFEGLCNVGSASSSDDVDMGGRKRRRHGKKTHKKHHKKHHKKTHKRRH